LKQHELYETNRQLSQELINTKNCAQSSMTNLWAECNERVEILKQDHRGHVQVLEQKNSEISKALDLSLTEKKRLKLWFQTNPVHFQPKQGLGLEVSTYVDNVVKEKNAADQEIQRLQQEINVLRLWQDSQSQNSIKSRMKSQKAKIASMMKSQNYIDNILAVNTDLLAEKSNLEQEHACLLSDFDSMKDKYGMLEYKYGKTKEVDEEFQTKIGELQETNLLRNNEIRELRDKTQALLSEMSQNSKYFEEVIYKTTLL
jgi:hypothetical protein